MTTWVLRTVRGVFLVALVFAVVTSAGYLLSSARRAPNAAGRSAASVSQSTDANLAARQTTVVQSDHLSANPVPTVKATAPAGSPEILRVAAPAASGAAPAASAGKYVRTEIAKLAYGTGAANVGLLTGPNQRPVGPSSFAVDGQGSIYVSDNVNGRVQVYSAQGNHLRSFKVDSSVYDLATDQSSDLYLLGTDGSLVVQDTATGRVKAKGAIARPLARELGSLRVENGQVSLKSPEQVAYPLTLSQPQGVSLVSSADQQKGQSKGWPAPSQAHYTTSYRDGGHVYRVDASGKIVQDISLGLPDVQTVMFLQEDRTGNIYVQVERVSADGQVHVEVRELGKKGGLLAVVPIDRADYLPLTRSTIVTADGTIYQLVPSAQGITLVKYARS